MRKRSRQSNTIIEKLEHRTLLSGSSVTLSISSSNLHPTVLDGVTLTAHVIPTAPGGPAPTGNVQFFDNGEVIGGTFLQPDGTVTTSQQLPLGNQSITAMYTGDANYGAADSIAPVMETVTSVPNTLDPSFGNGGILTGYEALGIQPNGQLIATRPDGTPVLLNPNGSVAGDYSGAVPAALNSVQGGTPLPPPLVVDGGKHLVLTAGSLTRYNSDNTVDNTFGVNGSVTDFISGTSVTAFKAYTMVAAGTNVLVVGEATIPIVNGTVAAVAVAAIDSNGSRVADFGSNGLAVKSNADMDHFSYGQINVAQLGPDGGLYVGADQNDDPYLYRFNVVTGFNDAQMVFQEHVEGPNLTGFTFQQDGKILVLIHDGGVSLNLTRLNTDFTPDTSFGTQGAVQILSPFGVQEPDAARADSLLVRNDGTILVSGMFDDTLRAAPDSYFTFGYLSHTATATLAASNVTPTAGDSVNLTAHVTPLAPSDPAPTGSVTFFSDGASIGSAAVQSDGTATLATTALSVGTHTITDTYGGDTNYGPADAATPVTVTVSPAVHVVPPVSTSLALSSSNVDPTVGDSVLLTAQVAPATSGGVAVTGTIMFFSDAVAIGTAPVQADGSATFSTADLAEGAHAITAGYGGDANYTSSQTSTPLTEDVTPISDFQAAASGHLPASVIAGSKAHINLNVHATSTGIFTFIGKLQVTWFLSTGTTIDSSAIALPGGFSKKLRIGPHKQATWSVHLDTIPASVPAGVYHLLLQVTDPRGGTSLVPSTGTIAVVAPKIDLSGKFRTKTPATTRAGAKTSETLVVNNTGNVAADGVLHFLLDATTDGTLGANAVQRSAHVSIKPGKSVTIHLSRVIMPTAAGSYFLVAQLDSTGAFHDADLSNNLVVSSEPIVVG
ncbi:MAG: hypothetical protein JWP03_3364 [Phycisphaerales bacterium]|jgi:hypothetical protein|nr:hypothetical protein [Phycisphaerales bacterium]